MCIATLTEMCTPNHLPTATEVEAMGTKEEEITVDMHLEVHPTVEEADTKLKDLMDLLLTVTNHKHKDDTGHHPRPRTSPCHLNMEVDTNSLNTDQVDINLRLNTEVDMELLLKTMATMATGITTSLVMAMVTETGSCKPCLSALSCRHLLRVVSLRPSLHLNHPRSLRPSLALNHLHSLHLNPVPNHPRSLHLSPAPNQLYSHRPLWQQAMVFAL